MFLLLSFCLCVCLFVCPCLRVSKTAKFRKRIDVIFGDDEMLVCALTNASTNATFQPSAGGYRNESLHGSRGPFPVKSDENCLNKL